jgi:hypothetical protein
LGEFVLFGLQAFDAPGQLGQLTLLRLQRALLFVAQFAGGLGRGSALCAGRGRLRRLGWGSWDGLFVIRKSGFVLADLAGSKIKRRARVEYVFLLFFNQESAS